MQIKYSPEADVLIIRLRGGKPRDANDLSEGIFPHRVDLHRIPVLQKVREEVRTIDDLL